MRPARHQHRDPGARGRGDARRLRRAVDCFKLVNDGFGHTTGDKVLREPAQRLQHVVRPDDIVSRFGGDEFVVLCTHLGERDIVDVAMSLAKYLHVAVEELASSHPAAAPISASIGIAVQHSAGVTADELVAADAAMYRAKARGRGRSELATSG